MQTTETSAQGDIQGQTLSRVVIPLLKGVLYREENSCQWEQLLQLQARVRDYIAVLDLELVLDESEGYAFLRARARDEDGEEGNDLPRLMARRPLSFPVSLLLALLRKKLAEFDASGGDSRLILSRDEIVELLRLFLPESSNEARLVDRIDAYLNKVVALGFLRRLKSSGGTEPPLYEVCRILKAFVDAQWLNEFDRRLAAYQAELGAVGDGENVDG